MLKSQEAIYNLGKFSDFILPKVKKAQDGLPTQDVGKRLENLLFKEGDVPPRPTIEPKAQYWFDNFHYYLEIIHSFKRLYQAYGYLQKYPRYRYYSFYLINELDWIRYHIEFFFQQNYIMHQRTVRWIRYLSSRAKHEADKKEIETRLLELNKSVDKAFKGINRIRGRHVHVFTFEERAFERAETATYLATLMKSMKGLRAVKNLTLFEIATKWRKTVRDNIQSMFKSYDIILGVLAEVIGELE